MPFAAPPITEDLVAPDFSRQGDKRLKLPRLKIGYHWIQYFASLVQEIETKPTRLAVLGLTGQSASVAVTPFSVPRQSAGIWRVSFTVYVLTPATVSSSLQVSVFWTQDGLTKEAQGAALTSNLNTSVQPGTVVLRSDAGMPISIAVNYASAGATAMTFGIDAVCELLSEE